MNLQLKNVRQPLMLTALALSLSAAVITGCGSSSSSSPISPSQYVTTPPTPATPIQHLVVIFQENVSFDHYFGTYPTAANPAGENAFTAKAGTPMVNNLVNPLNVQDGKFDQLAGINLLTANPTAANAANNANAINPFRLDVTQAWNSSQDHDYDDEQKAFDNTKMDLFPTYTGCANTGGNSNAPCAPGGTPENGGSLVSPLNTTGIVMGYFDGNTVTAYWNYAQNYAMSDNFYGTTFGPSAVGAINLISGQTNGVIATNAAAESGGGTNIDYDLTNDGVGGATLTNDAQPLGDKCSSRDAVQLGGKNIGDYLNLAGVTWGFFQGGFNLDTINANGTTGCNRSTTSAITTVNKKDYIPHHEPFQYYASTSNPSHARPATTASIGYSFIPDTNTPEPANHQYDIQDFFAALAAGNMPSVSFLKAPGFQDGHAGYSDPIDEQQFVVSTINAIQQSPFWNSTLIVIAYDDSDGWYDHQMGPIVNPSNASEGALGSGSANVTSLSLTSGLGALGTGDYLNGNGKCNTGILQAGMTAPTAALASATGQLNAQGRCGYGPRLPLLLISPYAKTNYVDHTLTDQTSILRFIEDNWLDKQRINGSFDNIANPITNMLNFKTGGNTPALTLDPATGLPQ